MSFRFLGTALSVLGTGASGYYLATATPGGHGPAVVVPVSRPDAPASVSAPIPLRAVAMSAESSPQSAPPQSAPPQSAPPQSMAAAPERPAYAVTNGVYWTPRIWVGYGASHNPLTGAPLTREEAESGWVDGPPTMAHEIMDARLSAPPAVRMVSAAPETGAPPRVESAPIVTPLKAGAHRGTKPVAAKVPQKLGQKAAQKPGHKEPRKDKDAHKSEQAKAGGGYRIHLESYRDRKMLETAWTQLRNARSAVLGSLTHSTASVNVKGKGTYLRLLAGPFATKAEAEQACAELRQSRQYCQPVGPGRKASS
ncbi:MAG: SPOR domain-containing protein [Rhodospirillaceae bacterium]